MFRLDCMVRRFLLRGENIGNSCIYRLTVTRYCVQRYLASTRDSTRHLTRSPTTHLLHFYKIVLQAYNLQSEIPRHKVCRFRYTASDQSRKNKLTELQAVKQIKPIMVHIIGN